MIFATHHPLKVVMHLLTLVFLLLKQGIHFVNFSLELIDNALPCLQLAQVGPHLLVEQGALLKFLFQLTHFSHGPLVLLH